MVGLVIAGNGNALRLVPPLERQKPDGQQEKQEDKWMGEEHGGLGSVRCEKLIEIVGREIGVWGMEPLFQLENER